MRDKRVEMRLMGLDVGDVRIGVAVSDQTGDGGRAASDSVKAGTRAGAIEQIAQLVETRGDLVRWWLECRCRWTGGWGGRGRRRRCICGVAGRADFGAGADLGRELLLAGGGWDYEGVGE